MNKDKVLACRVDKEFKELIDTILNEINNEFYDEPRKNYRYPYEFFKDNYMDNPNFTNTIKRIELKHQIEQIKEEREYLEYKLAKKEKELREIEKILNNEAEPEENNEEVYISPKLRKAIELLKGNCNQREIEYYEDIPHELFKAVSNSFKVKKTDLIRLAKQEFPNKEN